MHVPISKYHIPLIWGKAVITHPHGRINHICPGIFHVTSVFNVVLITKIMKITRQTPESIHKCVHTQQTS